MFRSGYAHKIKDSPQATCTFSLFRFIAMEIRQRATKRLH